MTHVRGLLKAEYRVVWKRDCQRRKARRFATLAGAERFMVLFGPEPWTAYTGKGQKGPDQYVCCPGTIYDQCACGGLTVRQESEERRKDMPPLEYVRIESRAVGEWSP